MQYASTKGRTAWAKVRSRSRLDAAAANNEGTRFMTASMAALVAVRDIDAKVTPPNYVKSCAEISDKPDGCWLSPRAIRRVARAGRFHSLMSVIAADPGA